jgi:hypothetical protein
LLLTVAPELQKPGEVDGVVPASSLRSEAGFQPALHEVTIWVGVLAPDGEKCFENVTAVVR